VWWDGSDTAATLTRKGSEQRMPDKGNFFGVVQQHVGALCAVDRKGANNQYVDQDKLIVLPDVPDEVGCLDLKCGGDTLSNQTSRAGHFIPMGFAESSFADYKANDVTCLRASGGTHGGGSENLVVDAVPFRKSRRAQSVDDHETWVADGTANTLNGFDVGDVRTTHAVAHAFYSTGGSHGLEPHPNICPPLKVGSALGIPSPPAVAFKRNGGKARSDAINVNMSPTLGSNAGGNTVPNIAHCMIVRRLTPIECERLQGFPDGWTDIPYRGKPAPDGPRYKALGNSMAVPCMAWIGKRIQMVKDGLL
jgi:DNA (cytosine-5)-methyltransferase 1